MDRRETIVQENRKERERLLALMKRLESGDFERRFPNGWTVGVALAHIAFWDLRQATMLDRWLRKGVEPGALDAEAINDPLATLSEVLPPEAVVRIVREAAETVDRKVEELTSAQVEDLLSRGLERSLRRALHRSEHLGRIDKLLETFGDPPKGEET